MHSLIRLGGRRLVAISGGWWRLVGTAWSPSLLPLERTNFRYYRRGAGHP